MVDATIITSTISGFITKYSFLIGIVIIVGFVAYYIAKYWFLNKDKILKRLKKRK